MKANELRIGNYILDVFGGKCDVRGITSKGIWIRDEAGPAEESFFNPIPLTEKWLEDFGYEKHVNNNKFDFYDFYYTTIKPKPYSVFITRSDCEGYFNIHSVKVYYVHQLQNLYFALTGQELTLNK